MAAKGQGSRWEIGVEEEHEKIFKKGLPSLGCENPSWGWGDIGSWGHRHLLFSSPIQLTL